MVEHLHRASFNAPRVPREEMIDSLQEALQKDILYELPANYMVPYLERIHYLFIFLNSYNSSIRPEQAILISLARC